MKSGAPASLEAEKVEKSVKDVKREKEKRGDTSTSVNQLQDLESKTDLGKFKSGGGKSWGQV